MKDYTVGTDDQLTLLLQGFRRARGLAQAELAAQMGITQQTLSSAGHAGHAGHVYAPVLQSRLVNAWAGVLISGAAICG
jgi:hypothetical protein